MKITFTQPELNWLSSKLGSVSAAIQKRDIDEGLARVVAKMRYKFSPNALQSFLNQKERSFLLSMLTYRQADLIKMNAITDELDTIQSLIEKIEGSKI